MPVHRVDGDPLQPLVVGTLREMLRHGVVIGHCRKGLPLPLTAGRDVDDQHRIGLFLHREELLAIGTDCDSFQTGLADEERLLQQHLPLKVEAENCLGVVADGVERCAVCIEREP